MFKYQKDQETSYALGTTLAIELLSKDPAEARRLYISPLQSRDATYSRLRSLAEKANIPVIENNEKIFRDLSGKDNVMAIGEFQKKEKPLDPEADHVVLVNPSNMGNLGTIIRCMAGFSFLDLAIVKPAADLYDPKVIRSSMGAYFDIRACYFSSFDDYIHAFPSHHPYPFMLQATTPLKEVKKNKPLSLVFGNEATGLDPSFLTVGTPLIIPHSPLVDSLNLDNAVAIALYEFSK